MLLDYYADWCVSCKIMEKQVFAKAHVLAALEDVHLLRLDVTADGDGPTRCYPVSSSCSTTVTSIPPSSSENRL